MKKSEIAIVAQLLSAIKDSVEKLEKSQKKKDAEGLAIAKQEILNFQRKIDEII